MCTFTFECEYSTHMTAPFFYFEYYSDIQKCPKTNGKHHFNIFKHMLSRTFKIRYNFSDFSSTQCYLF